MATLDHGIVPVLFSRYLFPRREKAPARVNSPAASRYGFIDLLRGFALIFMIETHVVSAYLPIALRKGSDFFFWLSFINGLVAPAFLFAAGFSIVLQSQTQWEDWLKFRLPFWKQMRRLGFIALIAYFTHLQGFRLSRYLEKWEDPVMWNRTLRVDVLQCIVASLLVVHLLFFLVRRKSLLPWAAGFLALGIAFLTPWVWSQDFAGRIPTSLALFLNPHGVSLFPVFPWMSFVLAGCCAASLFMRSAEADAVPRFMQAVACAGGFMVIAGLSLRQVPYTIPGHVNFFTTSPLYVLVRTGCVLLMLALLYGLERRKRWIPGAIQTAGRESLLVYGVHLWIIYALLRGRLLGAGARASHGLCGLFPAECRPRDPDAVSRPSLACAEEELLETDQGRAGSRGRVADHHFPSELRARPDLNLYFALPVVLASATANPAISQPFCAAIIVEMKRILQVLAVYSVLFAGIARGETSVISVRAVPPGPVPPGGSAVAAVELTISPPYHINSDRPLQDFLIPTAVQLESQPGVTFGAPVFPPAPAKQLPVLDEPMAVWEGTVRVEIPVAVASGAGSGSIPVRGSVRYQACNDRFCLPPATLPFNLTIPVGVPGTLSQNPDAEVPARPSATQQSGPVDLADKGLLATVLLVFVGGLALNLTPCVYPMIPITITYFGGQAQGKKGSIVAHAFIYVVGMAITYSVLGVVAAMTGSLFGAALQYPPVLVGIALVMTLLALSMFDVYELRMPQFLNRLAGGSQKGFPGTLLMGLTVGIVAAPCVGPFVLGLLTYVGNRGNPFLGFGLFFVLALGMGIPFLVLGAFSGSIRKLPRSGAWMVWVRKIFGFVLLAMAVYFLEPLFPGTLAYHLALALILLLGGIYLAWIDNVPGAGKRFAWLRNAVGILFFVGALYAAVTGFETYPALARGGPAPGIGGIEWHPYSEAMLSRAAREGKPVFIDFYADWCAPCKELDKHTFSSPEIVARSKDFVMLKVDLTSADDPQAEFLRKKYQARGVPTLVFLAPDGREIESLRGTGFEPSEAFLKKMDQALSSIREMTVNEQLIERETDAVFDPDLNQTSESNPD